MEYEVSYSNPHKVFLTEQKQDDLDITPGDPVRLEFDELEDPLVGKCEDISELDKEEELFSLISILHYSIDSIQDIHDGLFADFEETDMSAGVNINESIQDYSEFHTYISFVKHMNDERLSEAQIVLGCGIVDIITDDEDPEKQVVSPYSQHSASVVSMGLRHECDELIQVSRYDGEVLTSEELVFCTYQKELSMDMSKKMREHILDDRYIHPEINYEYFHTNIPAHGPTHKRNIDIESLDESNEQIILLTEDNISFNYNKAFRIGRVGSEDIALNSLQELFGDEMPYLSDTNCEVTIEDSQILIETESPAHVFIRPTENRIQIRANHITDEIDIDKFIDEIKSDLEDKLDSELSVEIRSPKPSEALNSNTWVLDTNSIYRQDPSKNYTSITDFVLANPLLIHKEILIPWNVVVEINRHKDSNRSSTANASEQGIENLKILDLLDEIGYLDLEIEQPPDRVDNSVNKNTGVTDISILNSVPEQGVLFTDDDHLLELANMMGISVERVKNVNRFSSSGTDVEDQYWSMIKDLLSKDGPIKSEGVISQISEVPTNRDTKSPDYDQIIEQKVQNNELIRSVNSDGDEIIALSKKFNVIPTFHLINKINQSAVEYNGNRLLPNGILNSIRKSIGGLPTSYRPTISFHVPVQYVLKSSEISQVNGLEQLTQIQNTEFKTIQSGPTTTREIEVDNIIIESAIEHDCSILCTDEEEMRKFRLLDIDYNSIRFK